MIYLYVKWSAISNKSQDLNPNHWYTVAQIGLA